MTIDDFDSLEHLIEESQAILDAELLLDRVSTLLEYAHEPTLRKSAQDLAWRVYEARLRRAEELCERKKALRREARHD